MKPITKAQAQKCLTAIKHQFAGYLAAATAEEQPRLFPPGHNGPHWVIAWEGDPAPYEWVHLAFCGGTDEDIAATMADLGFPDGGRIAPEPVPAGVFPEPINTCELGLYPA